MFRTNGRGPERSDNTGADRTPQGLGTLPRRCVVFVYAPYPTTDRANRSMQSEHAHKSRSRRQVCSLLAHCSLLMRVPLQAFLEHERWIDATIDQHSLHLHQAFLCRLELALELRHVAFKFSYSLLIVGAFLL